MVWRFSGAVKRLTNTLWMTKSLLKNGKDKLPSITAAMCKYLKVSRHRKNVVPIEIRLNINEGRGWKQINIPLMWFYDIVGDGFGSQSFSWIIINSQNVLMKSPLHNEGGVLRNTGGREDVEGNFSFTFTVWHCCRCFKTHWEVYRFVNANFYESGSQLL